MGTCVPNMCKAESVTLTGEAAVYSWPETVAGENATITCFNSEELIFRFCANNGEWRAFDDDVCGMLDDRLEMLLNETVSQTLIHNVCHKFSNVYYPR